MLQLSMPAHRLFVVGKHVVILYSNTSLSSGEQMLYESSDPLNQQEIVWCNSCSKQEKTYIVVVCRAVVSIVFNTYWHREAYGILSGLPTYGLHFCIKAI